MITAAQVAEWLKLPSGSDTNDQDLIRATAATNGYVAGLPIVANLPIDPESDPPVQIAWTDDIVQGGIMTAARLYRRRNSPNGVEAITESGATYVARFDSDISRLLQLESFQKPMIG